MISINATKLNFLPSGRAGIFEDYASFQEILEI